MPGWVCYTNRKRVNWLIRAEIDLDGDYSDESDVELALDFAVTLKHAGASGKKDPNAFPGSCAAAMPIPAPDIPRDMSPVPPKKAPVDLHGRIGKPSPAAVSAAGSPKPLPPSHKPAGVPIPKGMTLPLRSTDQSRATINPHPQAQVSVPWQGHDFECPEWYCQAPTVEGSGSSGPVATASPAKIGPHPAKVTAPLAAYCDNASTGQGAVDPSGVSVVT